VKSKTESDDAKRAKLLTDREEHKVTFSTTDRENTAAKLNLPYTDKDDPRRAKLRMAKDEPTSIISKKLTVAPSRATPLSESVAPRRR
jgi:hypothetical protein